MSCLSLASISPAFIRKCQLVKLRSLFALFAVLLAAAMPARTLAQGGTWTAVTAGPNGLGVAELLTDGTVMVLGLSNTHCWYKLTPNANGSYASGTWSQIASSHTGRLYFPSSLLKDGRVWVGGGEYIAEDPNGSGFNGFDEYHNRMEVYDPVSNTWTTGPDGLFGDIGDTGVKVLTDGRMLVSTRASTQTQIWNPATNSWTATGNKVSASGDEESWEMLPDGTVFDAEENPGERYLPSTGKWIAVAPCPVTLKNPANEELGAFVMLYTGQVFCLGGGPGHTALFTPPVTLTGTGSWITGPDQPNGTISDDAPACIEPSGKVLCITGVGTYGSPRYSEYDPATNTFTVLPLSPSGNTSRSDLFRLLALPNGQIFMTDSTGQAYVYTPLGSPQNAWRPAISTVTQNADGSYHLVGTQLNGLSEGGSYGDDANMSSNYPLVRLTSLTGAVHYCRTYNFSTMGLATGSTPVSTEFTLPAGLPHGVYNLEVVANGIASTTTPFTFIYGNHFTLKNHAGGNLLEDFRGGTRSGTLVVQTPAVANKDTQAWTFTIDANGYYVIKNQHSLLALDDYKSGTLPGTRLVQSARTGASTQRWQVNGATAGYYTFLNGSSGLALHNLNGSTSASAPVVQWTPIGGANQEWQITPVD